MSPRERVKKVLAHEEPDRVPVDLGSVSDESIHIAAYERLKEYLGIKIEKEPCFGSNFFLQVVIPDEEVMERLGVDCRGVGIWNPKENVTKTSDGSLEFVDKWGTTWKKNPSAMYFFPVKFPFSSEASLSDLKKHKWPDSHNPTFIQKCNELKERAKYLHEKTNYAVVLDFVVAPLTFTQFMLGFEDWCIALKTNPKLIEGLIDVYLNIRLEEAAQVYDAVGKYIDVAYGVGDDLATQDTLWVRPSEFRKYFKPVYKKIIEHIKSKTEAKVMYHSCGNVACYLQDLIDIGIDVFTPVQVSCKDMNSEQLKKKFGDNLTWWGGIDTQRVLPFGTREDVRKEVKKRIEDFAPGGGYVLAAVHSIQPGVPPENIVTMIKAAKEYGAYSTR